LFYAAIIILGLLALGWYAVMGSNSAQESARSESEPTQAPTISMEFVLIPAGEFDMGSPSNEVGRDNDEGPVHHVTISKAFYMGKYEVTQKQWRDVMGTSPSYFTGDDLPVERVSWDDVQQFIQKLNEKEGTRKYRLPSEAEWEYAARAGTTTRYSFGDDESVLGDYAWYNANSGSKTHEVGQRKPNLYGLYDMHGNVWEWVQDNWHADYNGAPTDGSSWESGSNRVFRGGSWYNYAGGCRSAFRYDGDPGGRSGDLGFRLLRIL
jgi:formylglycine-generating enzyme required for sulfatase activity